MDLRIITLPLFGKNGERHIISTAFGYAEPSSQKFSFIRELDCGSPVIYWLIPVEHSESAEISGVDPDMNSSGVLPFILVRELAVNLRIDVQ